MLSEVVVLEVLIRSPVTITVVVMVVYSIVNLRATISPVSTKSPSIVAVVSLRVNKLDQMRVPVLRLIKTEPVVGGKPRSGSAWLTSKYS